MMDQNAFEKDYGVVGNEVDRFDDDEDNAGDGDGNGNGDGGKRSGNEKHREDKMEEDEEKKNATTVVNSIIIDGPSLVYFIYRRLLWLSLSAAASSSTLRATLPCRSYPSTAATTTTTSTMAGTAGSSNISPPDHTAVAHATKAFLSTLQYDHSISIRKIYFDGGLPVSKRSVRLNRLEELRRKRLGGLRSRWGERGLPFRWGNGKWRGTEEDDMGLVGEKGDAQGKVEAEIDVKGRKHARYCWRSCGYCGGKNLGLCLLRSTPCCTTTGDNADGRENRDASAAARMMPEPPFMVASVMEELLRWSDRSSASRIARRCATSGNADEESEFSVTQEPRDINQDCSGMISGEVVEVVPGEADMWCARLSARTGAAVLTSDSDLLVFDLDGTGETASVIFLDSIQLRDQPDFHRTKPSSGISDISGNDSKIFKGSTLQQLKSGSQGTRFEQTKEVISCMLYRSTELSKRLGLSILGLQLFCFHVCQDPSLSSQTLKRRCDKPTHLKQEWAEDFDAFRRQYATRRIALPAHTHDSFHNEDKNCWNPDVVHNPVKQMEMSGGTPSLNGIDPRVAEVVTQLWDLGPEAAADESVNMYLPFLIEDPNRDAAWDYGEQVRNVAYRLLQHLQPLRPGKPQRKAEVLYEYQRRGDRILAVPLQITFDVADLQEQTNELLTCLHQYRKKIASSLSHLIATNARTWRLFGLAELARQRAANGKKKPGAEWMDHYLGLQTVLSKAFSWSDIHDQATVSAILGSWRILKQVVGLLIPRTSKEGTPGLFSSIHQLHEQLCSMPSLCELMDGTLVRKEPLEINSTSNNHSESAQGILRSVLVNVDYWREGLYMDGMEKQLASKANRRAKSKKEQKEKDPRVEGSKAVRIATYNTYATLAKV